MKNHHEVGHFKTRLMILALSLVAVTVMAGESIAATTCSTCHGMPPLDSADGARVPSTGAFKGSHQKHIAPGAVPADCVVCHSAAAGYDMKHSATSGNVIGISASINGGTYSKGVSFPQTATPVMGTCSNVSCHADVYSSGFVTTPQWGSTGNGCGACHTVAFDSTGPATGSHAVHNKTDCTLCHADGTSTTTKPGTGHLNGTITVTNGYPVTAKHAPGTYTGTCTTASCHDNGQGVPVETPVWGTDAPPCTSCHAAAPATRSHGKHLTGLASTFSRNAVCADCHKNYVQGSTVDAAKHVDGNVDVYFTTVGDLGYPSSNPKGDTPNSCSTAYCHSNGRSSFTPVTWGSTSTGCNFCHPTLSGKHAVHTNLATAVYGNTGDNSISGSYDFGCGNCHPTTASNHINNSVDITLNSAHGGVLKSKNKFANDTQGYTQNTGVSVTCDAAYCHSNGMATPTFSGASFDWYEVSYAGDKCARCHGNSPNTGGKVGSAAHSVHTVGIHYTDIYNGVSKKLPQAGSASVNAAHGRNNRSTTINCNICHAATVSSSANDQNSACFGCHDDFVAPRKGNAEIADKSKHVNGTVDISFINQKIATKAQVGKVAFASHTASSAGWTRNNNIYKAVDFVPYTSAYDVTKSTLFAAASYSQANGCLNVACHSGTTVKWNDTVTCTSCHSRLK